MHAWFLWNKGDGLREKAKQWEGKDAIVSGDSVNMSSARSGRRLNDATEDGAL